jgi:hypothetical protein
MLGRVRGVLLTQNYEDEIKSINDPEWDEDRDAWGNRDPFIFVPLLPYYIYQVPKVNELVQIMYSNSDFKYVNQFYIQNSFFSPTSSNFQYYEGGNKFTATGIQVKNPKWLKNRDGSLVNKEMYGVFPQPEDIAILGRGSSDILIKENDLILRSGKYNDESLKPNIPPVGNNQRGFLQLSRFNSEIVNSPNRTIFNVVNNVVLVKYLIEYVITNPENVMDKFNGTVYLYQLMPDLSVNSENITVNSTIPEKLKKIVASETFVNLSKIDSIEFINNFIKSCNNSNATKRGTQLFIPNTEKFPIFYRPNSLMYSKLTDGNTSTIEQKNISEIFSGIKLYQSLKGGFGLIYTKDKVGYPSDIVKTVIPQKKYISKSTTYSSLGGDKVFLLSHQSAIPGKGRINFDNTLYGIDFEKFGNEILPKTSSMVRGEEMMELINLIVRFLVSHTHAYPGLPPVPVTQDGTEVSKILQELQNSVNKILNENIRIN